MWGDRNSTVNGEALPSWNTLKEGIFIVVGRLTARIINSSLPYLIFVCNRNALIIKMDALTVIAYNIVRVFIHIFYRWVVVCRAGVCGNAPGS